MMIHVSKYITNQWQGVKVDRTTQTTFPEGELAMAESKKTHIQQGIM